MQSLYFLINSGQDRMKDFRKEFIMKTISAAGGPYYMSKTYEIVTEESAAAGDAADRGFEYEDNEFDSLWDMAKEIVDGGGGFEASDSRRPPEVGTWYSSEPTQDQDTGGWTTYSFHPEGLTEAETQRLDELIRMDHHEFNDLFDSEEFMPAEETERSRGSSLEERGPKKGATMITQVDKLDNLWAELKAMSREEMLEILTSERYPIPENATEKRLQYLLYDLIRKGEIEFEGFSPASNLKSAIKMLG